MINLPEFIIWIATVHKDCHSHCDIAFTPLGTCVHDSSAVLVLSEGQFLALVKEAASSGVLQNANFGTGDTEEFEADILEKDQEIQNLRQQLLQLREENSEVVRSANHSEEYELKEKAMASILKLVSMQDMTNLSRE